MSNPYNKRRMRYVYKSRLCRPAVGYEVWCGLGRDVLGRVKSWGPDVRLTLEAPKTAGPPELVSSTPFPTPIR